VTASAPNTGIGSERIVADGTEQQKQAYLPRLASGEWTGCLAVTEPDAGSEASNVRTTARPDGDHYVLDGEKCFITNAPVADVFTVSARTDPQSKGWVDVSDFIVERGSAGLETGARPIARWGRRARPSARSEASREAEAKGQAVNFKPLLWMEAGSGTTKSRKGQRHLGSRWTKPGRPPALPASDRLDVFPHGQGRLK